MILTYLCAKIVVIIDLNVNYILFIQQTEGPIYKMKKILSILLILTTLLTLASCTRETGEAPVGMKNAAGKANDFYLYVPEDWIVNTSDTDLMASARASENDSSNITMIGYADVEKQYENIESYWEYYVKEIESRVFDKVKDSETGEEKSSFTLISESETFMDENPAKKYEYSGKVAGIDLQYMQIIAKKDNVFYIFTYTSTPELYKFHIEKDTINTILKFFEFK